MSTGSSFGYQQPSYGGMGGYGSMYGGGYGSPYMGGYGSGYSPFGFASYGMPVNPYQSMGFGGYGGMGGAYNPYGGYGQVGLGYLPPPQQTINDTVANQFMQQYYGGAFGLGAQPQPRRQRPRNPFRREAQPLMQSQPQQEVIGERSPGTYEPVGSAVGQVLSYPESVVNPIQYDAAPLPTSFFSPGAFNSSLLNDLNYMRF